MSEWKPIETAPRDGTPILIFCPRNDRKPVCEAAWAYDYEGAPGHWTTPHGVKGRGYTILPESPTHWMPLPSPPSDGHR